jgi:branched-subunit amino acid ABC-type transport system permease component
MVAVGALGCLVQRSMPDRAMSLGELTPMLVTFGISLIIPNVLVQVFSNDARPCRQALSVPRVSTSAAAWRSAGSR